MAGNAANFMKKPGAHVCIASWLGKLLTLTTAQEGDQFVPLLLGKGLFGHGVAGLVQQSP